MTRQLASALLAFSLTFTGAMAAGPQPGKRQTFSIGDESFLLDGKPYVIRTGEMHFARVPREYWGHRLQLLKAMGMNAVCSYLFWNFHEFEQGKFNWSDQADAAEFCRLAQEEGLWVVLRPGPYVCAEWDGGRLPWWLLKNPKIRLRSLDPGFMNPTTAWFNEVGRVLGPLQVTRGGPTLLTQVEKEYSFYSNDSNYMAALKKSIIAAGFDVPLFACNPPGVLRSGLLPDLFNVANFGSDPTSAFRKLREVQPKGPLMCGEFYPGWFDTWGEPHHLGNTGNVVRDLDAMLAQDASFSLYMAHGGTTFGLWPGADRPFKPDTSSYDYDAPISEAGWIGDKFQRVRAVMAKHLQEGETLPDSPFPMPVMSFPGVTFTKVAPVFENLPPAIRDSSPRHMEAYDQGHGCTVYQTEIPAGPAAILLAPVIKLPDASRITASTLTQTSCSPPPARDPAGVRHPVQSPNLPLIEDRLNPQRPLDLSTLCPSTHPSNPVRPLCAATISSPPPSPF